MKRFKVLSFMSVFLLLFAGVALAQNATNVLVEVGYPCPDGQDECDTDAAVSRAGEGNGDVVNILVTLLDAPLEEGGKPATTGPNGELLGDLTVTLSTTLGNNIEANAFAADAAGIALGLDATGRANISYDDAMPGIDQVVVSVSSEPEALVGQASVNVVAPPATILVVRTLRNAAPPQNLYDPIPDQAGNLGGWEPAGTAVQVTVLAQVGGDFTPDPSLEGKSVIVKAYADYSEDGVAGGGVPGADIAEGFEEDPIAEATFTISGGQVTDTIVINNGGPVDGIPEEGLNVVFTAEIDEEGGISTTLMNGAGLELDEAADFTLDTVEMRSGSPVSLLVAMDPYGNGNLVMEEDCIVVFDDDTGLGGTEVDLEVILVDSLDNGVLASGPIVIDLSLNGGELESQLDPPVCGNIVADAYHATCTLQDQDPDPAGQVITQDITVADLADGVSSDDVSTSLVPGDSPDIDLTVTLDEAGEDINASAEVVLTLTADGDYFPFAPGETLEISATATPGGAQWISTSDFASAETTLLIDATDADDEAEGLQLPPISIFGPCTDADDENVIFTVTIPGRCDASADSDAINDIDPDDPATLAVVDIAAPLETDSDLDVPNYVGTDPVVVDTPILVGEGDVETLVLECGDLEVRDEFDNVLEDEPALACAVGLGFATVDDGCDVTVRPVVESIDTTQTLTCEATLPAYEDVDGRDFSLSMIEDLDGPSGDATALVVRQEAPQDQDGNQIQPCGEAIVQILANGDLDGDVPIQILFGEGTVEGAELRNLDADTALAEPLPENLSNGEVIRLVVYAPEAGPVNLVVTDVSGAEEPLAQGDLVLPFCGEGDIPGELEVTVTCGATDLCEGDDCTSCAAVTAPGMLQMVEGEYTWEINGVAAGTGNSIEVCPADLNDGNNTITATDTANGDIEGAEDILLNGPGCAPECAIDVIPESLPKSHWTALYPVVFRIETTGIEDLTAFTPVTIACDADGDTLLSKSVLKTGKAVLPNFGTNTTIIVQTALIWPAWWTQSLGLESETCTVTVEGCLDTDTFELNYLSVLGIPLSQ